MLTYTSFADRFLSRLGLGMKQKVFSKEIFLRINAAKGMFDKKQIYHGWQKTKDSFYLPPKKCLKKSNLSQKIKKKLICLWIIGNKDMFDW